jgi:Na+/proline symporter
MTENNKPEWFEITDADEKPALRKASKTLPISAMIVTALVLGIGAVVAQTQNQTPASATSAGVQQSQSAEANPTAAAAVVGGVAANKIANPSIANLPTGGGDDEDEGDDD